MKILKFSTEWCSGCKVVEPYFKEFKEQGFDVESIDLTESPEYSLKYNLRNLPTVIVEIDGELVEKIIGKKTREEYLAIFKKHEK